MSIETVFCILETVFSFLLLTYVSFYFHCKCCPLFISTVALTLKFTVFKVYKSIIIGAVNIVVFFMLLLFVLREKIVTRRSWSNFWRAIRSPRCWKNLKILFFLISCMHFTFFRKLLYRFLQYSLIPLLFFFQTKKTKQNKTKRMIDFRNLRILTSVYGLQFFFNNIILLKVIRKHIIIIYNYRVKTI